jgi:acetyl-CoA synthetase
MGMFWLSLILAKSKVNTSSKAILMDEANKNLLQVDEFVEPSQRVKQSTYFTPDSFEKYYQESIQNPEQFWDQRAREELTWFREWDQVFQWD